MSTRLMGLDRKIVAGWLDGRLSGDHDDGCEMPYRPWVCGCAERKRKAAHGDKEPDGLYFPPPSCTRCNEDLEYDDGDWCCPDCGLMWTHAGEFSHFTDETGDLDVDRSVMSPLFEAALSSISADDRFRDPEGRPSWARGRDRCTRCKRDVEGKHTCPGPVDDAGVA